MKWLPAKTPTLVIVALKATANWLAKSAPLLSPEMNIALGSMLSRGSGFASSLSSDPARTRPMAQTVAYKRPIKEKVAVPCRKVMNMGQMAYNRHTQRCHINAAPSSLVKLKKRVRMADDVPQFALKVDTSQLTDLLTGVFTKINNRLDSQVLEPATGTLPTTEPELILW